MTKRKTQKQTPPTTTLVVDVQQYVHESHRSSEQYGSWSEERSAEVISVMLGDETTMYGERITIPGTVKNGDLVYVLFMTYSSGDSYGSSSGNYEVFWVFTDKNLAMAALEVVKKANDYRNQDKDDTLTFKLEDGTEQSVGNPAAGYFENMEDVYLDMKLVGADGKIR